MDSPPNNDLNKLTDRIAEYGFVISAWRLNVAFLAIFVGTLVGVLIFGATALYNHGTAITGLEQKVENLDPEVFEEASVALTNANNDFSATLDDFKSQVDQITESAPVFVNVARTLNELTASLDRFNAIVGEDGKLDGALRTLGEELRRLEELRSPQQQEPEPPSDQEE